MPTMLNKTNDKPACVNFTIFPDKLVWAPAVAQPQRKALFSRVGVIDIDPDELWTK